MIIWILRSRFTISTWHSTQMTKRLMSQPHSIKLQMKLKNLKIFFFRLEYMICQKPIHNPFQISTRNSKTHLLTTFY